MRLRLPTREEPSVGLAPAGGFSPPGFDIWLPGRTPSVRRTDDESAAREPPAHVEAPAALLDCSPCYAAVRDLRLAQLIASSDAARRRWWLAARQLFTTDGGG